MNARMMLILAVAPTGIASVPALCRRGLLLVAVLVPVLTAVPGMAAPADAAPAAAQTTGDALGVELLRVVRQTIVTPFELTGTIEAVDSVDLGFRQSGRVTEVLVDVGARVARGDALARLDAVQLTQALNVAQAGLASAEAARAQALQASDRASALLDRGVGTRAARDAATEALSQAQGALSRAQSDAEQAARAVDDTVLRAPFDALVTSRDIAPGQIVTAAQPGLSLASTAGLEARFRAADVPLLDAAMGSEVSLRSIDVEAPPMKGRVTEVSPLVDPENGSVAVTVSIDNAPDQVGLLGASVRGRMTVAENSALVVPWTALMRHGNHSAVWRMGDDGRVSMMPVEVEQFNDDQVYLKSGIDAGDIVVGAGSQMLYPGRLVTQSPAINDGVAP